MLMKTYQPRQQAITRGWHLVDAKDKVLGRLATEVARVLMGKAKRDFAPHVDCGDHVVIINAEGIRITGNNKPVQKMDFRHSGYPGGDTHTPYAEFLRTKPDRAIRLAISGMLSKTRLRDRQLARLKIYKGSTHPHGAQFAVPAKPEAAAVPAAQG
jgi:large subunit ribosomal protein L13